MKKCLILLCSLLTMCHSPYSPDGTLGLPARYADVLLAENVVTARYLGEETVPCPYKSADCPDRCKHGTVLARFCVLQNHHYEQKSPQGDPRLRPGDTITVDRKKSVSGQLYRVVCVLDKLRPGDTVKMTVEHRLCNGEREENIRPVTVIEQL